MKFLLVIFLCCAVFGFSQNTGESLIIVHYDESNKANLGQMIYQYNFVNNVYAGREKIISVNGKKDGKDYIRCDRGENTLYKDRWILIKKIIEISEMKI